VALADLDGDGRPDLVLAAGNDPDSPYQGIGSGLAWNTGAEGEIGFVVDPMVTQPLAGVIGIGVALGDYDADGDLDVFIAAKGPNRLLRNDGARTFTDVTIESGVGGDEDAISASAVFADLDADGLLDLYVSNFVDPIDMTSRIPEPNALYLNRGDGRFDEVAALAHADLPGANFVTAVVDREGDGRVELYVTTDRYFEDGNTGDAFLVLAEPLGEGPPVFRNARAELGLAPAGTSSSMGVAVIDLNEDGLEDFLVTDIAGNDLYLSRADGTYEEATDAWGLSLPFVEDYGIVPYVGWGARFLDLDRDGGPELFVVDGFMDVSVEERFLENQQDLFFRSERGQPFEEIHAEVGLPASPDDDAWPGGRGLVVGDLDGDDDDDFVISPFLGAYRVFRNDTPRENHVVRVALRGTASSPFPTGARLAVTVREGDVRSRSLVAGGSVHSDDRRPLVVGLSDVRRVERVDVLWPSGVTQRIDRRPEFAIDRTVTIEEPRWYALSARTASSSDAPPELVVTLFDDEGTPLGTSGSGRSVIVTRSDALPVDVVDRGDGTYAASLPHPGVARRVRLTIAVDGTVFRTHPAIVFR
jgi:hypothetical protein